MSVSHKKHCAGPTSLVEDRNDIDASTTPNHFFALFARRNLIAMTSKVSVKRSRKRCLPTGSECSSPRGVNKKKSQNSESTRGWVDSWSTPGWAESREVSKDMRKSEEDSRWEPQEQKKKTGRTAWDWKQLRYWKQVCCYVVATSLWCTYKRSMRNVSVKGFLLIWCTFVCRRRQSRIRRKAYLSAIKTPTDLDMFL